MVEYSEVEFSIVKWGESPFHIHLFIGVSGDVGFVFVLRGFAGFGKVM